MNQKGKGNDNFQTPQYIFDQLNKIFNFTHDIACCTFNKLCEKGFCYDLGQDALKASWGGVERAYCNPPFSQKSEWIKKAHDEVLSGNCPLCVMVLPILGMSTNAWHDYVEGKFHYEVLRQRISFIDPDTGKPKSGNNSGTVIIYFWNRTQIK